MINFLVYMGPILAILATIALIVFVIKKILKKNNHKKENKK